MYKVPKIKKFNSIIQQGQKSWRSNLSSNSKRNILIYDIAQNLSILQDDLTNFFQNNNHIIYPSANEEYICFDKSSNISPTEELLYRLIDILKNDDYITRIEEAISAINSLSQELEETKSELKLMKAKKYKEDNLSSYRGNLSKIQCKELFDKLKERSLINQEITEDYDNLYRAFISLNTTNSELHQKVKILEANLKLLKGIEKKHQALSDEFNYIKEENTSLKNKINELKASNDKLFEDAKRAKEELQENEKMMEFHNNDYTNLNYKNRDLSKEIYVYKINLERSQEKLKLCMEELKEEKEKNELIINNLENKIIEKDKQINEMRRDTILNFSQLLEENNKGLLDFVLEKNVLKLFYNRKFICNIKKYTIENENKTCYIKKHNIISNIYPSFSPIHNNNFPKNKPRTLTKNNSNFCEINNFNFFYKLSKNEYEYDSGSSKKHSKSPKEQTSFRLDEIYDQISQSYISKSKSLHQSKKSKSDSKNKSNNCGIIRKSLTMRLNSFSNKKNNKTELMLKRAMTDVKKQNNISRNKLTRIKTFGFDVESIKEEKDEDSISITNFDLKIRSKSCSNENKNVQNNSKKSKIKDFSSISNFIENSICKGENKTEDEKVFVMNHVCDLFINKYYCYPNNLKIKLKKINIQRIVHMNNKEDKNVLENKKEDCCIF